MSFLAWAFAIGSLAIGFPLIFHLIRRTPRGRQEFSSLMFLKPSPPRLTRRSRLDNLLLLFLRALALILLAIAFMRPFLRGTAQSLFTSEQGRRLAILLDTSASMRRADLWQQALDEVEFTLEGLDPADDVALFCFDKDVQRVIDFEEDSAVDVDRKRSLLRSAMDDIELTWEETELGSSLMTVAHWLAQDQDAQEHTQSMQIVLITDLQQGARIEALQGTQWPTNVLVDIRRLTPEDPSNASIELLVRDDDQAAEQDHEVRIRNAADSSTDQFFIRWASDGPQVTDAADGSVAVYVPPGKSQVVRVARTVESLAADRLILDGSDASFDNVHFVVPVRQETVHVVYIGDEQAADVQTPRYYLENALLDTPARKFEMTAIRDGGPLELSERVGAKLVVATTQLSALQRQELEVFLRSGGTALVVLRDQEMATSLGELLKVTDVSTRPEAADAYALLGQIDFLHPLFAPLKGPRYNDFTKIHFWHYRHVEFADDADPRVIARFDSGDPAIWEHRHEQGTLFVLASGWHPADSQLALSTKFVPLLGGILERAQGARLASATYTVGDTVTLTPRQRSGGWSVRKPNGARQEIAAGEVDFTGTDQPGVYRLESADAVEEFAVNLAAAESDTAPMAVEQLEQFGIRLGNQPTRSEEIERLRKLRDQELEGRQKIWKWLIVAVLCVVVCETGLARPRSEDPSAVSEKVESRAE